MALNPDLLKRRQRTVMPRAPQKTLGARAVNQEMPQMELAPVGGVLPKEVSLTRTFRQTVAAATAVLMSIRCPLNGRITELNPHFPPGCNALVLMRFGTDRHGQCFPEFPEWLALDDASPVFKVDISVDYDERLWLEVQNGDALNPHTPSLTLVIVGR